MGTLNRFVTNYGTIYNSSEKNEGLLLAVDSDIDLGPNADLRWGMSGMTSTIQTWGMKSVGDFTLIAN